MNIFFKKPLDKNKLLIENDITSIKNTHLNVRDTII